MIITTSKVHSGYCRTCANKRGHYKQVSKLQTRICKECTLELDISCFISKDQKRSKLTCHKCQHLKNYGITFRDYQDLFNKQNGVCAICKLPETRHNGQNIMSLAVDHNHTSGYVRGLLCANCNRAIGLLKDDINLLKNAINYLK